MKISRRNFLSKTLTGSLAMLSIPAIVSASFSDRQSVVKQRVPFKIEDIILFQGDSITDAGREKKREYPNLPASLGKGYAFLVASSLLYELPTLNLQVYNRGISGNKVFQLAERWKKDCINLKPDWLSILIGVNDYWHTRASNYKGTVAKYENDYRKLLQHTKERLPKTKLVICEPFYVLKTSAVDETWVKPMQQYQEVAYQMASEFNAIWVPFQKVFDEAIKHAPAMYWTGDGVHPTLAGSRLMAESWLRAVKTGLI